MSAIKEEYIRRILKEVRFPLDRKDIKMELDEHFEEAIGFYFGPDKSPEEAESLAIQDFGDPKEIGRMLNKVHQPILGWLWILSRYALVNLVLYTVFLSVPKVMTAFRQSQEIKAPDEAVATILGGLELNKSNVKSDTMLDQRVTLKDATIIFERAILLEDSTLIILVQQVDRFDPFALARTDYPLRSQGSLVMANSDVYHFKQDGQMGYDGFTVLIAMGIPTDTKSFTIDFQGYTQNFALPVELAHD